MHFADYTVILVLALVLFGPKKLPEIARQIGKVMAELRRASNEFKFQMDEEMRSMEQQERQKKQEAEWSASAESATPALSAPAGAPEAAEDTGAYPPEPAAEDVPDHPAEDAFEHVAEDDGERFEDPDVSALPSIGEAPAIATEAEDSLSARAGVPTGPEANTSGQASAAGGVDADAAADVDTEIDSGIARMPTASREFIAAHEANPYPGYAKALADEQEAANHNGAHGERSTEAPAASSLDSAPSDAPVAAQVTSSHG